MHSWRCRGKSLGVCLAVGAAAAAEVISHFGARPEADLREVIGL
jgi:sugar/nucleoside kinase (ribokinase family)